MNAIFEILTFSLDYMLKPFNTLPPSIGLCVISAITGIIMLKLYGIISNQKKIRVAKDQIKANLLGIVLYKDDIRTTLKLQGRLLLANIKYLKCSLLPLIILVLICIPILAQLNIRYGYRPFIVGEKIKLFTKFDNNTILDDISIDVEDGLKILTPALRMEGAREVDWKLEALKPGNHKIKILVSGIYYTKEVIVGSVHSAQKLIPFRSKSIVSRILYPGEQPIPQKSIVNTIEIRYPHFHIGIFGYNLNWLVIFCVISILSGLLFKPLLKVEI